MGSSPGSKNSLISSIKTGFPLDVANPKVLYKLRVVCFSITNSLPFSRFLIHLFACCYGSIIRGHLELLVANIPFSIDTVSVGSPFQFHPLISTGLPIIFIILKSSLIGIYLSLHYFNQDATIFSLYSPVNAPQ